MTAPVRRPLPGDRIVVGGGECWAQYRYPLTGARTNPRHHDSRETAVKQAAKLAVDEGVAVFLLERAGEGGRFRLLRERLPR